MTTIKLELNESNVVPIDKQTMPAGNGKPLDNLSVLKKQMKALAAKHAHRSTPKKHRKKLAEECIVPLLMQLPIHLRHTETAEKLMAFCQLGLNVEKGADETFQGEHLAAEILPVATVSMLQKDGGGIFGNFNNTQQHHFPKSQLKATPEKQALFGETINKNIADSLQPSLATQQAKPQRSVQQLASSNLLSPIKSRDIPQTNIDLTHVETSQVPAQPSVITPKIHHGIQSPSLLSEIQDGVQWPVTLSETAPTTQSSTTLLDTQHASSLAFAEAHPTENVTLNTFTAPSLSLEKQRTAVTEQTINVPRDTESTQSTPASQVQSLAERLDVLEQQNGTLPAPMNANIQVHTTAQARQSTTVAMNTAQVRAEMTEQMTEKVAKIEGRSLTYTFSRWQSSPAVTFELNPRGGELLASTTSQEVHQVLRENQHLFRGEQPLSIRYEGQQHEKQRQQQQEHTEPEDN
ncbi:SpaN/EivJ family type III secretion system needle length determinant [Providencia vermicola]|uniref:SpaN/EivJ family type III secretion system needle length determinant n=1 Tax=Providencia vermicola TaxID=333965 RepID=UPI0034D3EE1F